MDRLKKGYAHLSKNALITSLNKLKSKLDSKLYADCRKAIGDNDPDRFVREFSGTHEVIADFLVEEVLSSLPTEQADYLIKSSITGRFCAPLCDAINGVENSCIRLEKIDHIRSFIQNQGSGSVWFKLHPLFRNFLRRQLDFRFPEQWRDKNRRPAIGPAPSTAADRLGVLYGPPGLAADRIGSSR